MGSERADGLSPQGIYFRRSLGDQELLGGYTLDLDPALLDRAFYLKRDQPVFTLLRLKYLN